MKRSLAGVRPLTAGLWIANFGLALVIAVCIGHGTQTAALLATPTSAAAAPPPHSSTPGGHAEVATIQSAPLFHASRRYFVPPAPDAGPATPPIPSYQLVGTFVIPNKPTLAILKQATTGTSRKVTAGEMLDGWLVQAVESRRVVLRYENESREILAAGRNSDPRGMPTTSPATPTTPATLAAPAAPATAATRSEPLPRLAESPAARGEGPRPMQGNEPMRSGYVNPRQPVDAARLYRGPNP